METPSRSVVSNQTGPHQNLHAVVRKHRASHFRKPLSDHAAHSFEQVQQWLQARDSRPLILDACCGVGQSSRAIARAHPNHWVIGVDKSVSRLTRGGEALPDNVLLLRADLVDFYRQARQAGWRLDKHFVLYPNPWPKSVHFGRRWHGSPVFPDMVALGGVLELRTNWRLYAEEFHLALACFDRPSEVELFVPETPLTPFEAKYQRSGQSLWRLTA